MVPRLRGLRDPQRHPGLHAGARPLARAHRLRLGDRLRSALPVLHADVRDALDPRARAGDRDRPRGHATGSLGLGRHGRRRRAVDRRKPPHPRAAPERQPQDPPLQQPDLRAHERAVLADLRAGEGDEVDAHGVARPSVQPALDRDRRRGVVRCAGDRHGQEGPDGRARCCRSASWIRVRRDPPELQHLQRRRVRGSRGEGESDLPRERSADPLRRGRRARRRPVRGRIGSRRRCRGSRGGLAPRPRCTPSRAEPRVRPVACHVRDGRSRAARGVSGPRAARLRRPHERAARGRAGTAGRRRARGAASLGRHLGRFGGTS